MEEQPTDQWLCLVMWERGGAVEVISFHLITHQGRFKADCSCICAAVNQVLFRMLLFLVVTVRCNGGAVAMLLLKG